MVDESRLDGLGLEQWEDDVASAEDKRSGAIEAVDEVECRDGGGGGQDGQGDEQGGEDGEADAARSAPDGDGQGFVVGCDAGWSEPDETDEAGEANDEHLGPSEGYREHRHH